MRKKAQHWMQWVGECIMTCQRCGVCWKAERKLAFINAPQRPPRIKAMCDGCIKATASPTLMKAYLDANGGKL